MIQSRGALYFHRLFTVADLGFGQSPEPFVNRLIREFLKIGEAVAGRWIEMPKGILILQQVEGQPDSGAIYLYDRANQVFYMLGFDGPDDNLTLEEFNQLLDEYDLLKFVDQPRLIAAHQPIAEPIRQPAPKAPAALEPDLVEAVLPWFALTTANRPKLPGEHSALSHSHPQGRQFWLQSPGSA